jgi:hypothetical protein
MLARDGAAIVTMTPAAVAAGSASALLDVAEQAGLVYLQHILAVVTLEAGSRPDAGHAGARHDTHPGVTSERRLYSSHLDLLMFVLLGARHA